MMAENGEPIAARDVAGALDTLDPLWDSLFPARLRLLSDQIKEIEAARLERLERAPDEGPHAMVPLLAQVRGLGIETADMLVHELLARPLRDPAAELPSDRPDTEKGPANPTRQHKPHTREFTIPASWHAKVSCHRSLAGQN